MMHSRSAPTSVSTRFAALLCSAPNSHGERTYALLRASVPLPVIAAEGDQPGPLPEDLVWMPAGRHEICAKMLNGDSYYGTVVCDELGAQQVMRDYDEATRRGYRVYFDFNHEDGEASAWVRGFSWDPARGIVARLEWSGGGERALREKLFYSFSPTFWVDRETGRVAGLIHGAAAGGLVNCPAFGPAMPALIAARMACAKPHETTAGAPGTIHSSHPVMNKDKLLRILASMSVTPPADATEDQLLDLVSQHATTRTDATELSALKASLAQLQAAQSSPEGAAALKELQKQVSALQAAAVAEREERVTAAVQAAVDRGAIAKDDATTIAFWTKLSRTNDEALAQVQAMKAATRPMGAIDTIVTPDVIQAAQAAQREQVQINDVALVEALKAYAAAKPADPAGREKQAMIYARHIGPVLDRTRGDSRFALGPILASNSLGSLAGNLITQRSLSLLKYFFPALVAFSTDFTDASVKLNQQVISRIKTVPSSANYVAGTGYATQNAVTTDVPVTISNHKGIPIEFNVNELSSTERDLFAEQVEGAHQRIGLDITTTLYALLTVANFANETVSAVGSFNRAKVASVAGDLYARGVGPTGRALLLNNEFFGQLQSDSSIVAMAAQLRPELITEYMLPKVAGMQPYHAITLEEDPDTEGQALVGFGGTPDALVIATRLPADYSAGMGGGNGSISAVRNPDTGITVQLVQYVDHGKAAAYWRLAYMWGVAVGQAASGQRLVSAATES